MLKRLVSVKCGFVLIVFIGVFRFMKCHGVELLHKMDIQVSHLYACLELKGEFLGPLEQDFQMTW
jgi:hypothetical protein